MKDVVILKRDGRSEPYSRDKLNKISLWACNDNDNRSRILLDSVESDIYSGISTSKIVDLMISVASMKISAIQPSWDDVAKNLCLLKMYKDVANLKQTGYYPPFLEIVDKGLKSKTYSKEIFESFTYEELMDLGDYIKPDRDFIFSYKGLNIFSKKYCIKSSDGQIELPQNSYMRTAIHSFFNDDKSQRIRLIKEEYDALSTHCHTYSTPRALNSGTPNPQLASCVLTKVDDDTTNIKDNESNIAQYSKFGGGIAVDITSIRSSGCRITGNRGISSGPVRFIQSIESTISAFDQGGLRPGSCIVYYPDWHSDLKDIMVLKDAGGAESNRARHLKYAMKISRVLLERVRLKQKYTLFNPLDTEKLQYLSGDKFKKLYEQLESRNNLIKKQIDATDIAHNFTSQRKNTGHQYIMFPDNVNEQNIVMKEGNEELDSCTTSNLCTEITVTCRPSTNYTEKLVTDENGKTKVVTEKDAGEVGLCNLLSINLMKYFYMTPEEKDKFIYTFLRGADNVIESQFYPVKEAKYSNIRKRPIGVGVTNFANLLATNKLRYTDDESLKFSHELFEDIYYRIYYQSTVLAEERGPFEYYKNTRWSDGETPLSLSILHKKGSDHELNFEYKHDWSLLSSRVKTIGVRFSLHGAIAPTACMTTDSKFKTKSGDTDLNELLPKVGIDLEVIQNENAIGWYDFNQDIVVPTAHGDKSVNKVWYNGQVETRTIEFEDGNSYTFSLNHKLKLTNGAWKEVGQLTIDDEIAEF